MNKKFAPNVISIVDIIIYTRIKFTNGLHWYFILYFTEKNTSSRKGITPMSPQLI